MHAWWILQKTKLRFHIWLLICFHILTNIFINALIFCDGLLVIMKLFCGVQRSKRNAEFAYCLLGLFVICPFLCSARGSLTWLRAFVFALQVFTKNEGFGPWMKVNLHIIFNKAFEFAAIWGLLIIIKS